MIGVPPPPALFSRPHPRTPASFLPYRRTEELLGGSRKRTRLGEVDYDAEDAILEDDFLQFFAPSDHGTSRHTSTGLPEPSSPLTASTSAQSGIGATPPCATDFNDPFTSAGDSAHTTHLFDALASLVPDGSGSRATFRVVVDEDEEDDDAGEIPTLDDAWPGADGDDVWGSGYDDTMFDVGQGEEVEDEETERDHLNEELSAYLERRTTEAGRVKLLSQAILSTRLTQADNDKLQTMPGTDFEEDTFPSEYRIRAELRKETNFAVKQIDCCGNGCMAFTGAYTEADRCPLCKRDRWIFDRQGHRKPRQTFTYISPLNRLRAIWRDKEGCEHMKYRQTRTHDPDLLEDIFDGMHFEKLREQDVTWAGETITPPRKYFEHDTDVALGLGTDGIPLFKRSPVDCWPLVLTNYSMPDYLRNRKENLICCGLIPGRKEKRFATAENDKTTFLIDTFLQPLVDDLKILAIDGVQAVRWEGDHLVPFTMKAHLVVVTGDMPAISKVRVAPTQPETITTHSIPSTVIAVNAFQGHKFENTVPMLYDASHRQYRQEKSHVLSLHECLNSSSRPSSPLHSIVRRLVY